MYKCFEYERVCIDNLQMINRYRLQISRINQYPTPYIHIVSSAYREGGFDAKAMIIAPQNSIYKHHKFLLNICADNFPFKAPRIVFLTKIYHPNVDNHESGQFCCCKMPYFGDRWAPTKPILLLLTQILEMIVDPEKYLCHGHQNIIRLYKENRAEFIKNAEEWCQKYCEKQ